MAFSFIKNDGNSFSYYSRVYEVYNYDEERYLRTALVIGYLPSIEKYYITMFYENGYNEADGSDL